MLASNDTASGQKHWSVVIRAVSATYQYVDSASGLFNGTKVNDWGRVGQGGQNKALNALYYHKLLLTARIGSLLGQSNTTINDYTVKAAKIKQSLNDLLYDPSAGLFFDNTTTVGHTLHPQDGNVLAVLFNLTQSPNQTTILQNLASRHTPFGALAPELPGAISPSSQASNSTPVSKHNPTTPPLPSPSFARNGNTCSTPSPTARSSKATPATEA